MERFADTLLEPIVFENVDGDIIAHGK